MAVTFLWPRLRITSTRVSDWIAEVDVSEPDDDNHMWSVVGSPPFTDDARRERPAVQDHQTQGGLSKAKPPSGTCAGDGLHIHALGRPTLPESSAASRSDAADDASQYLPSVIKIACEKFELFHGFEPWSRKCGNGRCPVICEGAGMGIVTCGRL